MPTQQESRWPYKVLQPLTLYPFQGEEYGLDETVIKKDEPVFADMNFSKGRIWRGFEVIEVVWGNTRYYAKLSEFKKSTEALPPASERQ